MIADTLENLHLYTSLNPRFAAAAEFLKSYMLTSPEEKSFVLDGDALRASVSEYEPQSAEGKLFEAHRKFIDIQFVVEGGENIGWTLLKGLQEEREEFSAGGDIAFYSGDCAAWVKLTRGMFVILFPEDAHMPCVKADGCDSVKKIVVKCSV